MENERMDYARCFLNDNDSYIAIYTPYHRRALRTFIHAIKSLRPTRTPYPQYHAENKKHLRYTVKTIHGEMSFMSADKHVRIYAGENRTLIEHLVDLMNGNEDFQWIGEKQDVVVVEEVVHHHCDFRYDKTSGQSHFYFDLSEPFSQATFETVLAGIPNMEILKRENLFSSWGPLESCDQLTTPLGELTISSIWEGIDTGYTISGDAVLMEVIVASMRKSPYFSEV